MANPDPTHPWSAASCEAFASTDSRTLVPTGFTDLDCVLGGGLQPGTLTVLSGPAGVGASTLLLDIVRHNVFHCDTSAVLYDADRNARDIVEHVVAAETDTPRYDFTGTDTASIDTAHEIAANWTAWHTHAPLTLAASPNWGADTIVEDITARGRSAHPPALIGADPLLALLANADGPARTPDSVARALKVAAMQINVPIIVAAGFAIDPTDPSIDTFSHIPDTVIQIYRPDLHDRDDRRAGEVELRIIKGRAAAHSRIVVGHALHTGRFVDLARG